MKIYIYTFFLLMKRKAFRKRIKRNSYSRNNKKLIKTLNCYFLLIIVKLLNILKYTQSKFKIIYLWLV